MLDREITEENDVASSPSVVVYSQDFKKNHKQKLNFALFAAFEAVESYYIEVEQR